MSMDFVAIDFETANFTRASACAVGVARVEAGKLVALDAWYIDPPGGPVFTNTFVHGITADHVRGAIHWGGAVDRIAGFASDLPLIGYSGFDRGVYNAANALTRTGDRDFTWNNGLSLAQRRIGKDMVTDHRLPTVANHLGVTLTAHHDPQADALACAEVVLALAARDGISDLESLWPARTAGGQPRPWYGKGPIPVRNDDADPLHPLFGHSICFSGTPNWVASKAEAQQIAADFGATVEENVTRRTTMLVVGDYAPGSLREGAKFSGKFDKAQQLRSKGQLIDVLDGDEFRELANLDHADYR